MLKRLLITALSIFVLNSAFARDDYLFFYNLTSEDGIPHNEITDLHQDTKGFIWIATHNGLAKYDGYSIKHFNVNPDDKFSLYRKGINGLIADNKGNIWIKYTEDGALGRLDKYTEKIYNYLSNSNDSNSLCGTIINQVFIDSEDRVWIATNNGLNKYNPKTDNFTNYKHETTNSISLPGNTINHLFEDDQNRIWIATNKGLSIMPNNQEQIIHVNRFVDNSHTIINNNITVIEQDAEKNIWLGYNQSNKISCINNNELKKISTKKPIKVINYLLSGELNPSDCKTYSINIDNDNNMWVGFSHGILRLTEDNDRVYFKKYVFDDYKNKIKRKGKSFPLQNILEDNKGNLWISSTFPGAGLFKYNTAKDKFDRIIHKPGNPNSLTNNTINCILEDTKGLLWIGTDGGISKLNLYRKQFHSITPNPDQKNNLIGEDCSAVYEQDSNFLWIGTKKALNKLNLHNGLYTHYQKANYNMQNNKISAIAKDPNGYLWIGYLDQQISKFFPGKNDFINYSFDKNEPSSSLKHSSVYIIHIDDKGNVWSGGKHGGLGLYNRAKDNHFCYLPNPDDWKSNKQASDNKDGINSVTIWDIVQSKWNRDILWIATAGGGLNVFNRETEKFVHFMNDPNDHQTISSNILMTIHESADGIVWIGTIGGGLNKMTIPEDYNFFDVNNKAKPIFKTYSKADGLAGNTIRSILEDDYGNLWIGTNNGLSKFNPEEEIFANYSKEHGLPSNEFNTAMSCFNNDEDKMYFGTAGGMLIFHPDSIVQNPYVPEVMLTNIKLFNKEIKPGDTMNNQVVLDSIISLKNQLILSHKNHNFAITFASNHYAFPDNNKFAYKLDGYNKNWIYTDAHNREAVFTNMNPGSYVLNIKSSNHDDIWNKKPLSLEIIIRTPWWLSWWFYTLSIIIFAGIVFLFVAYREWQARKDKEKLKKELELEKQNLEEQKAKIQGKEEEFNKREIEEQKQKWYNNGIAFFGQLFSESKDDIFNLSKGLITQLIKYTNASQGAVFVDPEKEDEQLTLIASYAYNKSNTNATITYPDDKIQECFNKGRLISLNKKDGISFYIKSGLGESYPEQAFLVPLKQDDTKVGVLEISTFKPFEDYKIRFLQEIATNATSYIAIAKANEKMQRIIEKANMQTEELKSQEEELRQNIEEITALKEEKDRKFNALNEETQLIKKDNDRIIQEINELKNKNIQ
jgi:ligand-binding sensor domain-containing protein